MSNSNLNTILKPIITEASLAAQEQGKYYFLVDRQATKDQIAATFKEMFGQKALAVNIINLKAKKKTNWKTRKTVLKNSRKKAIITTDKKHKIELLTFKEK